MIPEMQTRCSEDRLELCNLRMLEKRGSNEVFKIMHGMKVWIRPFF